MAAATAGVDDEARWQAVVARERAWDGLFVFAVRSTGVYCRPSCPARRPRRDRVAFFAAPDQAEAAGFRSCRRCRPREVGAADPAVILVQRACRRIEEADEGRLRLPDLARALGTSARRLQRAFRQVLGLTPRQYAEARRLDELKRRLRKGDSVTGALYDAGFGSSSRLYEDVQGRLGMTPARYRRGGRGLSVRYTIASSPLGRILVAATERGVAAVSLGESDTALEDALRREFPAADLSRDDAVLRGWLEAVLGQLAGAEPREPLPLDVKATAFQFRVWQALRAIPRGQTRTYAEVAREIGRPTAARAVARACASNPLALLVPCHRVVESGGGLGGYRWGVQRKRALLDKEKADTEA